jgi:hypothetical protein
MELEIMRYELTDHDWFAIKPLLPYLNEQQRQS